MTISVLLACREEDAARSLFAQLLLSCPDLMTGAATHLDDALRRVRNDHPDVLLLECSPQEVATVAVMLSTIGRASPGTRILLLWDYCTASSLLAFVQHGACGCLLRSSSTAMYAKAIACVHAGGSWFGRGDLVEAMRCCLTPPAPITVKHADDESTLTPREHEILELIGTGMSNKEIGRRLAISDQTVKTHLHHIYVKLERSGRYKAFLAQPRHVRAINGARA